MESRDFATAELTARYSVPKNSLPNPSGRRTQRPALDLARAADEALAGLARAIHPYEAADLADGPAVPGDAGPRRNRGFRGTDASFEARLARRIGHPCSPRRLDPGHRQQDTHHARPNRRDGPGTRKGVATDWHMRGRGEPR